MGKKKTRHKNGAVYAGPWERLDPGLAVCHIWSDYSDISLGHVRAYTGDAVFLGMEYLSLSEAKTLSAVLAEALVIAEGGEVPE